MSDTYKERVLRYRVLRHEELPESHKEIYRERGIDPDNNWSLIWSFYTLEAAEKCLSESIEYAASYETYKLVDAGQETLIERVVW